MIFCERMTQSRKNVSDRRVLDSSIKTGAVVKRTSCTVSVLSLDQFSSTAYALHAHPEDQLLHAIDGVMTVRADTGSWVVPAGRAVWVPAGTRHEMETCGEIKIRSVFIHPADTDRRDDQCRVISVSPLLRELIVAAALLPEAERSTERALRMLMLIHDEIMLAPPLSLHVPLPRHGILRTLCEELIAQPSLKLTLGDAADRAGQSERTLARAFVRETGMTFGAWRRRTRLVLSLPLLAQGKSVWDLAVEHGYESASAFTAMFRRELGMPPRDYLRAA